MAIVLVTPPSFMEYRNSSPRREAITLHAGQPALGVVSLSTLLAQEGETPTIVDLNGLQADILNHKNNKGEYGNFFNHAMRSLCSAEGKIYGFSTLCHSYPFTLRLAEELKRKRPDAIILLGGPQASVVDYATLTSFPFIDLIVRGEAEKSLPQVIDAINGAGRLEGIHGITFQQDGKIIRNRDAEYFTDPDELPIPDFSLLPRVGKYTSLPIEAGRGCPWNCTFCSTNRFFRKRFRLKSAERLLHEISTLKKTYGVDSFKFIHDNFTANPTAILYFCRKLSQSRLNVHWACSSRTDCLDNEMIDIMAAGGCRSIFFGVETGSARMQQIIKKNLDLTKAQKYIASAAQKGIVPVVSFITGFPQEMRADIKGTVDFIMQTLQHQTAVPQLHLLSPLMGTPLYERYRDDLIFDGVISDFNFQGLAPDPKDLHLAKKYRDIFSSFYSFPLSKGKRSFLRELQCFLMKPLWWARTLYLALHQSGLCMLDIFESWMTLQLQYREENNCSDSSYGEVEQYYDSNVFRMNFLRFLSEKEGKNLVRIKTLDEIILLEKKIAERLHEFKQLPVKNLEKSATKDGEGNSNLKINCCANSFLIQTTIEYDQLVDSLNKGKGLPVCLSQERTYAIVRQSEKNYRLVHLSKTAIRFMELADGTRSFMDIWRVFEKNNLGNTNNKGASKASLLFLCHRLERLGVICSNIDGFIKSPKL